MRECKKCHIEYVISDFPRYRNRVGDYTYRWTCKTCYNLEHLIRIYGNEANKLKKFLRDKSWRQSNPDKVKQYRENQKGNMKVYCDTKREILTESYVRNRLGIKMKAKINPALIEAKRLHIKLVRLIKESGYEKYGRIAGRFS